MCDILLISGNIDRILQYDSNVAASLNLYPPPLSVNNCNKISNLLCDYSEYERYYNSVYCPGRTFTDNTEDNSIDDSHSTMSRGRNSIWLQQQLVNETRTPMGCRLLQQWLKEPLQDIRLIEKRQDAVTFMFQQLLCNASNSMNENVRFSRTSDSGRRRRRKYNAVNGRKDNNKEKIRDDKEYLFRFPDLEGIGTIITVTIVIITLF